MSADLFELIKYLLPGLLAAWIFYGLCAHQKPEQFERVIQALIFTVIVQALVAVQTLIQKAFLDSAFETNPEIDGIFPALYATIIGIAFAWGANRDFPHRLLRKFRLTEQTSYPSEWFGVFSSYKTYIVLHLLDERRLYGWPKEWPQSPDRGHFFITQPSWLLDGPREAGNLADVSEQYLGDDGVEGILVCAKDVRWVEIMQKV